MYERRDRESVNNFLLLFLPLFRFYSFTKFEREFLNRSIGVHIYSTVINYFFLASGNFLYASNVL